MRPIRFRVWDNHIRKFIEHRQKDKLIKRQFGFGTRKTLILTQQQFTFLEYTGLTDKNGREIYEGDIVRLINATGFTSLAEVKNNDGCFDVEFQKGLAVFDGVHHQYTKYRDYVKVYVANHAIEIIGNIYENPELLEVKQ